MNKTDELRNRCQFSLRSLFELTTLCCLLASSISLLGFEVAACLMLFSVALHYRWGLLSISSLLTIFPLASARAGITEDVAIARQAAALLAVTVISAWYWFRYATPAQWPQTDAECLYF
jgi:hypothetical protein